MYPRRRPLSLDRERAGGIGSNRFLSIRVLSTDDVLKISNLKALPRKGFQLRFCGGWYSIIPHPRFIEILSTSEFMGGIYERSKFNALQS